MAKKKVETKVENQNVLNKYLIKKGEREVLETFGEYKVYAPNKEFAKSVLEIMKDASKNLDKDNNLEIKGDALAEIYRTVTNLPDDFVDNMNEILKATEEEYELPYDLRRTIVSVAKLVSEVAVDMQSDVNNIVNMNPAKRDLLLSIKMEEFTKKTE